MIKYWKANGMKIGFFSAKHYDMEHFDKTNQAFGASIEYFDYRLCMKSVKLAHGFEAICAFVNDSLCEEVLVELAKNGTKIIAMRCAGFNNVDLVAAERLGLKVVNVPAYSPESVAEHTVALMLTLNRKVHKAYQRTRDANFSLEGLVGFNMHGRTVGVIGTGKIGLATIKILLGFGCTVIAHDPYPNQSVLDLGVDYVSLDEMYPVSDIITLHCPLTDENHHLLSESSFNKMKMVKREDSHIFCALGHPLLTFKLPQLRVVQDNDYDFSSKNPYRCRIDSVLSYNKSLC